MDGVRPGLNLPNVAHNRMKKIFLGLIYKIQNARCVRDSVEELTETSWSCRCRFRINLLTPTLSYFEVF